MTNPWETPPPPWETTAPDNIPEVKKLVENSPGVQKAQNWVDALSAGWQSSATGMLQHKPNMALPENASFGNRMAGLLGQFAGDAPFYAAGFFGGGAAGAAATSETGPGAIVGGGTAALFGAGATPEAVRQVMTDVYSDERPHTAADIAAMIAKNVWETTKAGALNLIGGKAAGLASHALESAGASALVKNVGSATAFAGAATEANSVLNGRAMPDWQDFGTATVLALGFHAVTGIAGMGRGKPAAGTFRVNDTTVVGDETAFNRVRNNLKEVYRTTGIPPWQAVHDAAQDPKLRDEIFGQDVNGNPVTPKFNATRPAEIEPFGGEKALDVKAHVEELLPKIRTLEGSADDAISPKGAIGRYQIMPGTAREYGFDPSRLADPVYNEMVARAILSDLSRRFHGDTQAVLIAYNAGPGRAFRFLRDGRNVDELPPETQHYLMHAGEGESGGGGEPPKPPAAFADDDMSPEARRSRFENKIGEETIPEHSARWGWEFELTPLREVDQELKKRGLINETQDLGIEDAFRSTYNSDNITNHFLQKGPVDAIDHSLKVEGPSFKTVMDKIDESKGNRSDFSRYVLSLRSIEKAKLGIDLGLFKPGEAEANVEELNHKYTKANELLQQVNDSVLKYARDSGALSDAQVKAMKAQNLAYMSIRRIMGDDAPFKSGGKGPMAKSRNPLKRMEGSNRDITDPLIATQDNIRMLIRFADQNRAKGNIVGSVEGAALLELKRLTFDPKATLAEPGSDIFKPYQMGENEENAVRPIAVKADRVGPNNFVYYRQGKPEMWEAKDPELATVIRNMGTTVEAGRLEKVARAVAAFERVAVVGSPDFGLRVGVRHDLTLWQLGVDGLHPPPFIGMIRHFMEAFNKGDEFQKWLRLGAFPGQLGVAKPFQVDMGPEKPALQEKLWNVMKSPLEAARLLTEVTTNASRIGVARYAEAHGRSPEKAAMLARVGKLDYDEKFLANLMNQWAAVTPFMRAGALGVRFAKDSGVSPLIKGPLAAGKIMLRVGYGLILPTIAMNVINRAQDKDLPENLKSTNIPQYFQDNYINTPYIPSLGHRLHIPLPYVVGPLFHVPLQRFMEQTLDDDPHAWDSWFRDMGYDMVPSFVPAFAKAPLEAATNYNFMMGKQLMSDSMKSRTRDMQWTENTTEIAKKISKMVGGHDETGEGIDSPPVIENFVREWGGTLGFQVLHALDMPFEKTSPPSDIANTWFLRWLIQRNPQMDAKPIDDFYKDAEQFVAQHADIKPEVAAGETEEATADAQTRAQYTFAHGAMGALSIMRQAIRGLDANTKMNDDEKRQLEERVYTDAIRVAKYGNQFMRGKASVQEGIDLGNEVQADLTSIEKQAQGQPQ
jgi:hypothetical protein